MNLLSTLPKYIGTETGFPFDEEQDFNVYKSFTYLPKISIVTPSYGQGEYIETTIRSILLQNYPNLEYIVIDGGSKDNTVDVIKKYENNITYWISEKDSGQSDAINKGIAKCTGDVFNWLNSDDYYDKNCFYNLVKRINENPNWHCISGEIFMFGGNYESKVFDGTKLKPTLLETMLYTVLVQPVSFFNFQKLKSTIYVNINFHYCMDQELWLRFLIEYGQKNIFYTENIFTYFRVHNNSKTGIEENNNGKDFYSANSGFFIERNLFFSNLAMHIGEGKIAKAINAFAPKIIETHLSKLNAEQIKFSKELLHRYLYLLSKNFNEEKQLITIKKALLLLDKKYFSVAENKHIKATIIRLKFPKIYNYLSSIKGMLNK